MPDQDFEIDGTCWDSFVCYVLWGLTPGSYVTALLAGRMSDAYSYAHPLLFLTKYNPRWKRNGVGDFARLLGYLHIDGVWGNDRLIENWSGHRGLMGADTLTRTRFLLLCQEGVHNVLVKAMRDRYLDGGFPESDIDWLPEMR